jgi:hypothetical protein
MVQVNLRLASSESRFPKEPFERGNMRPKQVRYQAALRPDILLLCVYSSRLAD